VTNREISNDLLQVAGVTGDAESLSQCDRFEHSKRVSDKHVRRLLKAVAAKHIALCDLASCTSMLKEATTNEAATTEEKARAYQTFQTECISTTVSATYLLNFLLMLHRIVFGILGREAFDLDVKEVELDEVDMSQPLPAECAAFLEFLHTVHEEKGLELIISTVRNAVNTCGEEHSFLPDTPVTVEKLETFLFEVCEIVDEKLLIGAGRASFLVPDNLDDKIPTEKMELMDCLSEVRSALESSYFVTVFQSSVKDMTKQLVAHCFQTIDNTSSRNDSGEYVLAKLFLPITSLSTTLLTAKSDFIDQFAEDPTVDEFCKSLFFQLSEESDFKIDGM